MTHQFQQVLTLGLRDDIPDFLSRVATLSKQPVLMGSDIISLALSGSMMLQVDAILVSIHLPLDESFLSQLPKLRYIGVLGSSTKKIDLSYCQAHTIKVSPVHEYCDHETAEWVLLQILKFYRDQALPHSVYQKTLGLVGTGSVGHQLAKKALGLGLRVNFNTTNPKPELSSLGAFSLSKADLFKFSQVISFHTPAHECWLTRDVLHHAPEHALLINTCLGTISPPEELELFLRERPDVTIIMDSIAAASYPSLKDRALFDSRAAYDTVDSRARLIEKFFGNAEKF